MIQEDLVKANVLTSEISRLTISIDEYERAGCTTFVGIGYHHFFGQPVVDFHETDQDTVDQCTDIILTYWRKRLIELKQELKDI